MTKPQSVLAVIVWCGWWLAIAVCSAQESRFVFPGDAWDTVTGEQAGLRLEDLNRAKAYALSQGGSGMIVRDGKVVVRWGDPSKRYDIKSASKSFGATALGLAIKDGKLRLDDLAKDRHPKFGVPPEANAENGWLDEITLMHLATQTAGFAKPGGYEPLLFRPGTKWQYSDGGPNWLAECVTLAYQEDIEQLMFERVFEPIGLKRNDVRWRRNAYRVRELNGVANREFGAGVNANANAMARLGLLYLREGKWDGEQILAAEFVKLATQRLPAVVGLPEHDNDHGNASDRYGLLWWNNADGALADVPRDAYWAWGLYDSLIVVIPSLDLVVARCGERGKSWPRKKNGKHYDVLRPLLQPIVAAATSGETSEPTRLDSTAPYPPSPVIRSIEWAPQSSIVRRARGSDNWPITWGDDDRLYTAYGDGHGFAPRVKGKLSLGLATVNGGPLDFVGTNLRSSREQGAEQLGDGKSGGKASGLLMVGSRLFMLVRNTGNSQLGWSDDHGKNWKWADWKFETSFGCPTLLNYGANYAGAIDEYVYVYSFDSDSAYQPADRMVMARVSRAQVVNRLAYEFFVGVDASGKATWSKQIDERGAVFEHSGRCYRSGITYSEKLQRFLWVQIVPDIDGRKADTRFEGGLGIYDSATPWGPWTTVSFAEKWDVGPGESASFPAKWMSRDGRTLHLVFSGDDCFSVRRATLMLGK